MVLSFCLSLFLREKNGDKKIDFVVLPSMQTFLRWFFGVWRIRKIGIPFFQLHASRATCLGGIFLSVSNLFFNVFFNFLSFFSNDNFRKKQLTQSKMFCSSLSDENCLTTKLELVTILRIELDGSEKIGLLSNLISWLFFRYYAANKIFQDLQFRQDKKMF